MREDKLAERSMEFAVQIIELTKTLRMRKEFIMANQIGRSGTSIGANIREVHYAQSRDDFVSKLEIALKEANETDYWLELLFRTGYLPDQQFRQLRETKENVAAYAELRAQCAELRVLLIASCRTAKQKPHS